MKLLLDTCVWGGATAALTAAGRDVRWMGETDPDPGDEEIMRKAYDEGCVLIHAWERKIRPRFPRSWKSCQAI